jgi:hypothetical protein
MAEILCAICANPSAATFEERVEHGCTIGDEAHYCAWCGTAHPRGDGPRNPIVTWCGSECHDAHQAANPTARHFAGWLPIEDTMPGGRLDGVWENSGLSLGGQQDE